MAIVRTRRSLWVVLNAECIGFPVLNSCHGIVIQVSMRDFQAVR